MSPGRLTLVRSLWLLSETPKCHTSKHHHQNLTCNRPDAPSHLGNSHPFLHNTPVHTTPRRIADIRALSAALRAGEGTLGDLERMLAFTNEYMYKVGG